MQQHHRITLIKLFLLLSLLTEATAQAAAPLWTLTPAPGSNPTQEVPQNSTATVSYVVQNQSRQSKNVILLPITGIQQTTPCRMAPNGQPGSSCTLNLLITSNDLPQGGIHGGPVVCQANADGSPNRNQCYQPSKQEEQLKVSQSTTPEQAALSFNPTNLSFIATTISSAITLTNTSTLVTATGLVLTPSTNLMLVNNACGNTLLPQESCTFALTSSVASTGNTLTAKGTNTPSIQLTASVTPVLPLAAVGYYYNGSQNVPLSYTSNDNGTTWSLSATLPPTQGNGTNQLKGISCTNTGHCIAVGYYRNGSNPYYPLTYTSTDNGATWILSATLPPVQGSGDNALFSVSCDTLGRCAAVGNYVLAGKALPLSYTSTDNGNNWILSATLPPPLGATNNGLSGVSCDQAGHCAAVGIYYTTRFVPMSFISSDHGANWSVSSTQPPAQGSIQDVLNGVSCNSSGHCAAVGLYTIGSKIVPLSYTSTDHGTTWSVSTTLPPPQGNISDFLTSVSCDNADHCAAVGAYNNGSRNVPLSYISSDNGVTWLLSSTLPPPQGSGANRLESVVCDDTGHCAAVGYYTNGGQTAPLSYTSIDHGATWMLSTTLPPPKENQSFLSGVSGNGF
ncbi:exo-alpha-sialidase [Legionella sp. km535]|uniref:sialidase family protein n=1 Tax=Legionella sp. km535 TaxID=2498107 RepID=UPI000F8DE3F1|nr:sialidase family protein [Legionella sp. km535]RUR18648.1 exo-alpha-sialidase [Legionella sp. km535]